MNRLIERLFKRRELSGDGGCPPYLITYRILQTRLGGIFLHHFIADDWSLDLHDHHPYLIISIGLAGGYIEETLTGIVRWGAPWIRLIRPVYAHRIVLLNHHPCWTLIVTLPGNRKWGFWRGPAWQEAGAYLGDPSTAARRSC